ncbi:hypothetical protein [uncultured Campylobacter sp.]|uniref:hypothetical protein n=1 Tax=uncultured Campylobacter sp. TaxID=218934 RepID=UPI00260B078A|nr:hypothetical protein [uncultured Campylobacter sp.]
MSYFKNLLSDLRNGRLALHPILLAATFCIVKISWPYLIGPTGDDGSGGTIFGNFIFWDLAACACFIALGAHLVYVAGRGSKNSQSSSCENSDYEGAMQPRGLRYLVVLRAILCALCIIACVVGYLTADVNHQKLGVLNWFFPTALASAFIYLVAIWVVTTDSEIIAWGAVFGTSYVVACYVVCRCFFAIPGGYGGFAFWKGLEIIFPLIWAFHFKRAYKKRLAEEMREA